jgi:hypothetical protein
MLEPGAPLGRPVVLLLVLAAAGCGGSVTRSDEPLASPSPSGAPAANMRLLAQVDLGGLTTNVHAHHDEPLEISGAVSAAGNWGYTSPSGRRFALTGTSAGTSIVEVTDGARPRPVALIQGPASQWREIRTYGEYVYVTTEARHGLDIISMKDPDHPEKVRTWNRTFQSAHTLWIDEERGLLFANGTNTARGTRVLDLRGNPEDPDEVGSFDGFYIPAATRSSPPRSWTVSWPSWTSRTPGASARSRASTRAAASPTTRGSRATATMSSPRTSARAGRWKDGTSAIPWHPAR